MFRVLDDWYPVCRAVDLGDGPRATALFDVPLVLFRAAGGAPVALVDRCPHRNYPLSLGRVREGALECGYHGWRFGEGGRCLRIPGLVDGADDALRGRGAEGHACREAQGLVWVWGAAGAVPTRAPYRFPHADDPAYATVVEVVEAEAPLHAVAENVLDVPHTSFLHGGLFRDDARPRRPIEIVVRRHGDRAEAEYHGERAPGGLAARLLAPGQGGEVEHVDRFVLPSIAEVEYRLGARTHVVFSAALQPLGPEHTRLFAVLSFRLPFPPRLVFPALRPLALRIFRQDAAALRRQTENVRRFGGPRFASTDVDLLGHHVTRLLRNAERGDRADPSPPVERTIRMGV